MASSKRSWEGHVVNNHTRPSHQSELLTMDSEKEGPVIQFIFENFRSELDEHHDRREKIIKASRDITALSKKIIFALQRVRTVNAPIPPNIAKENKTRFNQIIDLFKSISPDLAGTNSWRYQRQVSGGIQEFIEAISFEHYIQTQCLITLDEVAAQLPKGIIVTEEDYLMGIFDLTGEMMRFAVTTLSTGGQVKKSDESKDENGMDVDEQIESAQNFPILPPEKAGIVVDLRYMRAMLEKLNVPRRHSSHMMKDMYKKMDVMQNSVEKVERAAYGLLVRGSERPSGWTPDLSSVSAGAGASASTVEVESY
ncbi:translin-associated factor TraX, putative [Talaromyces stipitatus ATCC 10500]|uniref:Translin-associated factor TraX, putative n=1 Tax=Talaromyces stipitatus (strain ATCC 10500 / CBS 375.48 / QM 6759 / NRRL 1006) TaxID=441959 RepID=B8M4B9_TALSN|nr:translin-associated factor TraX, putative [Talaromyces stipitatus ATCC 10500]EED19114.1 translin-associated factor TraX, putative [Talaromyces stipitatus ATCC 10500]